MLDRLKEAVGSAATSLYNLSQKMPRSVRLLLRDILEGAAAAVSGVTMFWPANADDAKKLAVTVAVAIAAAVVAVVRRFVWQQILDHLGPDEQP